MASVSMRQLLSMLNKPRIDLLKIDVEGAEVELFKRDLGWLDAVRCIALEFHEGSREKTDFDELMKQHGFTIVEDTGNIVVALREPQAPEHHIIRPAASAGPPPGTVHRLVPSSWA